VEAIPPVFVDSSIETIKMASDASPHQSLGRSMSFEEQDESQNRETRVSEFDIEMTPGDLPNQDTSPSSQVDVKLTTYFKELLI
jgi:hypothetical protein